MDNNQKSVVSMLASDDKLTLFTITGEVISIVNDGTYDMKKISEYLTPKLTGTSAADIDLSEFGLVQSAVSALEYEESGIVVSQIINGKTVQGIFYPQKTSVQVTVGEDKIIVPNVDNLTGHIKRAAAEKSPSVANFLKRLAPVLKDRKHSGEDLMAFIKHSEMPLTNDGRIIAYKRVKQSGNDFVDSHSGTIKQRVGSRVSMEVDLVDSSRHNSCSTGLHVANLGYLRGFSGSHTLIVLVNPEDFIAVPHGENTKARVCSYDIIGVMSAHGQTMVNSGSSVHDDPSFEQLIKDAVAGNIKPPFEQVFAGQKSVIKVVPLNIKGQAPKISTEVLAKTSGKPLPPVEEKSLVPTENLVQAVKDAKGKITKLELPTEVAEAFQLLRDGVSKSEVARKLNTSTRSIGRWIEKYGEPHTHGSTPVPDESQEVSQEDLEATAEMAPQIIENLTAQRADEFFAKPLTKAQQARQMYEAATSKADMDALIQFKKASKKSWFDLSILSSEAEKIINFKEPVVLTPLVLTKSDQVMTVSEQVRALYDAWAKDNSAENFKALKDFKKAKKKSWFDLGLNDIEIGFIQAEG